jgi:hypothetical protein
MKYRIIEVSTTSNSFYYQAQFKFLNLFWMNCDSNDLDCLPFGCATCSLSLESVEEYIECKIKSQKPIKVIKTYEI